MAGMVFIGLGSNLGDRNANLHAALDALNAHPAVRVARTSTFYETVPLGSAQQPDYVNAVAALETSLEAGALLLLMRDIEDRLGRVRAERWQPRTIDLDLLLFDQQVIVTSELTIPHPGMHLRSFVLRGLCELGPELIHPVLRQSVAELYRRLNGRDFFIDAARPQLISIAGLIGVGKTTLASRLAECLNAKLIVEKYDDNPYLAEVYAGRKDMALDSELFFLSSSATQLRRDRLKPGSRYVSDYVFDKALIYASSWLEADDLELYKKHFSCVTQEVAEPVLAIYLYDDIQQCLDRIHRRNRPYEQQIETAFLDELRQKYEALYADWTTCPLVRLNAQACVHQEQVIEWAAQLRHYLTA